MNIIEAIKKNREAGTPGPWMAPYETWDNGWSLDTDSENSYVGIGPACEDQDQTPIAITAVESLRKDDELDANAARIARVPELEEIALAAAELMEQVLSEENIAPWETWEKLQALLSK